MPPVATFRIVPGPGGHLAVLEEGVGIISEGVDLRNELEAVRFIEDVAREGGLIVNAVKAPGDEFGRFEASVDPTNVRFSMSSLREIDQLKSRLAEALRRHAVARVVRDGRRLVEAVDVEGALADAISEVAKGTTDPRRGN